MNPLICVLPTKRDNTMHCNMCHRTAIYFLYYATFIKT